ncbi:MULTISPECIES: helix-turn-helix domain-containing protein [Bacillus]|uniref:Helix-turn-helix transcriptional regulator n=2 Tax=Bacillus TaxID=1386 RepID=A0ABU6H986_9BACI|nr:MULTISPECIES: helix-turn-helix transcriptional regulator [Bacillus]MEC0341967.1 helix-turn-helix transcriptional regulator [Bacillus sonorensis]MEC0457519.1 helix-turn-helix transcriptional regulator [Bacillus sonorensis]MEC0487195.1 helix-turn-helix transcriptional regulator [Bacillus glycinifermentans]MEC0530686.1 helix-turn-helix transcriptional regulator [Bacillus sonorensis]
MKKIVLRIDDLIGKHGLNQEKFADKVKIRPAAVSKLVRNHVDRISIDHLERIVNAFNLGNINDIIQIVDDNNNKKTKQKLTNESNLEQPKQTLTTKYLFRNFVVKHNQTEITKDELSVMLACLEAYRQAKNG